MAFPNQLRDTSAFISLTVHYAAENDEFTLISKWNLGNKTHNYSEDLFIRQTILKLSNKLFRFCSTLCTNISSSWSVTFIFDLLTCSMFVTSTPSSRVFFKGKLFVIKRNIKQKNMAMQSTSITYNCAYACEINISVLL